MVTVQADNSLIDEEQLNQKLNAEKLNHFFGRLWEKLMKWCGIETEDDTQKTIVEVTMLRTNWVFRQIDAEKKNDFLELIDTLDGVENPDLYSTDFVKALIQEFWDLYYKLFDFVLIPFII
jgi:uncharacterized FlaG/YvyC family protein